MLTHPTHDRLIALGLGGMAKAFAEQRAQPAVASLTFEERLGLLIDREAVERESKRLVTRLKFANLRQNATVEDLNTKAARGLDKALFAKLATGDWISRRQDLLITGKTGTGKSWLACALGMKEPGMLVTRVYTIPSLDREQVRSLVHRLEAQPGVREVQLSAGERTAYLRIDATGFDEQHVLRLIEGEI